MRRLLLLAAMMEAAYLVFLVIPFPLLRYYDTPLLDLGKLTGHGPWLATAVVMAVMFFLYMAAYRTQGDPQLGRLVVVLGIVLVVTLMLVYPIGALDIFDYAFYGREMAVYKANPYLVVPNDFSSDPFLSYMGWKSLPFTYGPLWAVLSWGLGRIGGNSLLANLLVYKVVVAAAYALSAGLIYVVLRREMPQRTLAGTVLFAWNPLVVFEVGANGHNDILLVLFLVIGVVAWTRQRKAVAIGSVALSVLTKFVTAPLGLVWLVAGLRSSADWRRRALFVLASVLVVAGLTAAVYWPFVHDQTNVKTVLLAPLRRQELFTSSFPALLVFATADRLGRSAAETLARNLALAGLLTFTVYQAWRVRSGWQDVARTSYNVLLFYLLFSCLWFQPWYIMWIVPLAALLPAGREAMTAMLFSLSAMAKYLVFDFFWYWNPDLLTTPRIETLAVVVIYMLPLAYVLLSVLQRQWSNTSSPPRR